MSFQYSNRIVDPMGLVERSSGVIDPFIFVPRTPRGPILKDGGMVPMPTLPKITGPSMPEIFPGGGIFTSPRGSFEKYPVPDNRYPDFRIPRVPGELDEIPRRGYPDFELLNFPRGGGSSIPDYIVPAAQLLGTFLGKILNK
jgi:hypothetical protein